MSVGAGTVAGSCLTDVLLRSLWDFGAAGETGAEGRLGDGQSRCSASSCRVLPPQEERGNAALCSKQAHLQQPMPSAPSVAARMRDGDVTAGRLRRAALAKRQRVTGQRATFRCQTPELRNSIARPMRRAHHHAEQQNERIARLTRMRDGPTRGLSDQRPPEATLEVGGGERWLCHRPAQWAR